MDSLIAVDVAILPPAAIAETAIALSALLPASGSHALRLDAAHLPHITLTQQFIPPAELSDAGDAIERVLRGRVALRLAVTGPGRGRTSVWMQIARTPPLDDVHRALMEALQPFERTGGGADAFAGGDARPGDVAWVSGFRRASSAGRFTPHITLGHSPSLPAVHPMTFDATTIALCHLGRYCTCRRILRSWSLAPVPHDPDAR